MNQEASMLLIEIVKKVKSIFPEHAEIVPCDHDENVCADNACYKIGWYSNDDPERKHKRSKQILLILSREFFEDYQSLNTNQKQAILGKACEWIKTRYKNFDSTNHEPRDHPPTKEIWFIPFNGASQS